MQVWEILALLGISIVVICAAVLVRRYGNSLSSRPMEAPLGHDIAPSRLLQPPNHCASTFLYAFVQYARYSVIQQCTIVYLRLCICVFVCLCICAQ